MRERCGSGRRRMPSAGEAGRQGVEVLWAKETTLRWVWQLVEDFGGDVVAQGVVLAGEHLHRVLQLGNLFSQFLNL